MSKANPDDVSLLIADAISEERRQIEVRLIEQEHRTFRVLSNLYKHCRSEDQRFRKAAWKALFWRIASRSALTLTAGSVGLLLTVSGVVLAFRANTLLERQTHRMDIQNMLTESQRRSAFLASELSGILASIETERRRAPEFLDPDHKFRPSEGIIGRLVSLTLALRPYRPIEMEDPSPDRRLQRETHGFVAWLKRNTVDLLFPIAEEQRLYKFSDTLISPERGQLLLALLPQKLDFDAISRAGATFAYADLSNSIIHDVDLGALQLRHADFTRAKIENATLRNADLYGSKFVMTKVVASSLGPANEAEFSNVELNDVELEIASNCKADHVNAHYTRDTVDKLKPIFGCRDLRVILHNRESAERLIDIATNKDRFMVCIVNAIAPSKENEPSPRFQLYEFRERREYCPYSQERLFPKP